MKRIQIEAILGDIRNKKYDLLSIIYDNNGTTVLEHLDTPRYLVKISNKDLRLSKLQQNLLKGINTEEFSLSKVHHAQSFSYRGENKTLEIIDKLSGVTIKDNTEEEIAGLIKATKSLQEALNQFKGKYQQALPNLNLLFNQILQSVEQPSLRSFGQYLLADTQFQKLINVENDYITFGDMVYENILFHEAKIGFIDLDPLIMGAKELQIAILVTSNILLQKEQFETLSLENIEKIYKIWGFRKLTRVHLLSLCVFPFLILSMKQVDIDQLKPEQESIYYKLKFILYFLKNELEK